MKRLLILQPLYAHYRENLFAELAKQDSLEVFFYAGNHYLTIKKFGGERFVEGYMKSWKLLGHIFYYLKGVNRYIKEVKPDIILSGGVDFHLIHIIIIFIYHRLVKRKEFFWWSHAKLNQQGSFGKRIRMFFYKKSSGVLCYSQQGASGLKKEGLPGYKVISIGNCMNTGDYGYLNNCTVTGPNKAFTIIYCGRISKERRIDILLKAVALLKIKIDVPIRCFILGDGERNELKALTTELGIQDITTFTGGKYGPDVYPYFSESDIMVYPWAIGLSLLHAYSFGLPVITTNNTPIHGPEIELLEPGNTGDFYTDGSHEHLAQQLLSWYGKLKDHKTTIKNRCIEKIEASGYLPDVMADKMIRFINKNTQ